MRVAIDARRLQDDVPGGVARWIAGLLPHLTRSVDVVLLADARRPDPPTIDGVDIVRLGAPPGVPSLGWLELAARPWLRRFDGVFHGTFYALPLGFRGRGVLTLHDIITQTRPQDLDQGHLKRTVWRLYARSSVRRARSIVTVSRFVQEQIVAYFGVPAERVFIAPNSPDHRFSPELVDAGRGVARRLGVDERFLVAVGGARRRNLPVAIEAWRRARTQTGDTVALVVVGEPGFARDPALAREAGLVDAGALDDDDWPALLSAADAFVYPTRHEGYGLPAIEAAASGTPVVCARVSSLPEVLGDAAAWCAAPTVDDLTPALTRLLGDPRWRASLRDAGLARAKAAPTAKDAARAVLDAYEFASR